MSSKKIRVMIIDDSISFRHFLSRALSEDPAFEVVGTSMDAINAKKRIGSLRPDIIVLDMELPVQRGGDFLREILPIYPQIKVIVVSAFIHNVYEALQAGAIDFVPKPDTRPGFDEATFLREIIVKIKDAVAFSAELKATAEEPSSEVASPPRRLTARPAPPPAVNLATNPRQIIAIGASTGGTEALAAILEKLPATTPGVLVVQHMPPVFTKMFADRLNATCHMSAKEAQNGDRVSTGEILIAPGDKHMRLHKDASGYLVRCTEGERVSGHCPSVDVLFESVAKAAGSDAVGILLTGMGTDGARQLLTMKRAGAYTIGQDRASSVVYGMPMAAQRLGALTEQLPLSAIPDAILRHFSGAK